MQLSLHENLIAAHALIDFTQALQKQSSAGLPHRNKQSSKQQESDTWQLLNAKDISGEQVSGDAYARIYRARERERESVNNMAGLVEMEIVGSC